MKKVIALGLMFLYVCTLVACRGNSSGTSSGAGGTSSKQVASVGGEGSSTEQQEEGLYYDVFDLSKFDPTKFDGIIHAFYGHEEFIQAPLTLAQITEKGWGLHFRSRLNLLENERLNLPWYDKSDEIEEVTSLDFQDANGEYSYMNLEQLDVKADELENISVKESIEQGYYCLELGPPGNFKVNKFVNTTSEEESDYKQEPVLIETLGNPSRIVYFPEMPSVAYLCYEYEEYTLVFQFMGMGQNHTTLVNFQYYPKPAWDIQLEDYRNRDDRHVIE